MKSDRKDIYPDALLPVAQVLKSYGTEGEVIISFYSQMPDEINLAEPIFLFFEGLSVPYFISSLEFRGTNKALVKFEDIDTLEEAEEIIGQKIYLPEDACYNEEEGSDEYIEALRYVGYSLINQEGNTIGTIKTISDFSGNICMEVGENLYPYHQDLVIKINSRNKTICINIPEGL